jgi:hypothetical protein
MFAAALIYSAKGVELSIYSTCKRISQKLLRNVLKFLGLIYEGLKVPPFKEIRCNMEELVLQGPDGPTDVRIVNSYPSKVFSFTHARASASLRRDCPAVVEVLDPDRAVLEPLRKLPRGAEVLPDVLLGLLVQPAQRRRAPLDVRPVIRGDFADESREGGARDAGACGRVAFLFLWLRHVCCCLKRVGRATPVTLTFLFLA